MVSGATQVFSHFLSKIMKICSDKNKKLTSRTKTRLRKTLKTPTVNCKAGLCVLIVLPVTYHFVMVFMTSFYFLAEVTTFQLKQIFTNHVLDLVEFENWHRSGSPSKIYINMLRCGASKSFKNLHPPNSGTLTICLNS